MPALGRRTHHRNAGVLVGLELVERIDDECDIHASGRAKV
jgi:hypothetical protein